MKTIAILLAGGTGSRLGADIPKQFIKVNKKEIFQYSLETLQNHPMIDGIWVVTEEIYQEHFRTYDVLGYSLPGETRQGSIRNAVNDISALYSQETHHNELTILIHDSARPCLSEGLITRILIGIADHQGVMPVLPMTDTVYECDANGKVTKLLERERIYAGQAPEAFELKPYKEAMDRLSNAEFQRINGSTEPAIIAGMDVVTVPGDKKNFKITTQEDLAHFQDLMKGNHSNELQSPF